MDARQARRLRTSSRAFRAARAGAERRLRRFRQGTLVAVAMTGMIILLFGITDTPAQEPASEGVQLPAGDTSPGASDPGVAIEEATGTLKQLADDFAALLPKVMIAVALLLLAGLLVKLVRLVLERSARRWEKAVAASALSGAVIWLTAIGVALSVIAGDARALVGSVGLLGLALSWALQAPIESFAGWLLNSFKGYYRVGDRIAVGEVFGDVYRVDALTTTVWEAGGPHKPVQGAQPTGALITFPNSEVLRTNIVNYTRGFPYVWDEVTIGITNESDLHHAMKVIGDVAERVVGEQMRGPVARYRELLERERLAYDISEGPQLYLSPTEAWVDVVVRYLVPARERRKWSTLLHLEVVTELAMPENRARVKGSYPVTRALVEELGDAGRREATGGWGLTDPNDPLPEGRADPAEERDE